MNSTTTEPVPSASGRFAHVLLWEFVQNLPLVAGFLLGLLYWPQGRIGLALACMATGSILGAVAIWATESKIIAGHREPVQVVITNAVVMVLLMLVLAAYLSAPWSRWWTDLLVGLVVGSALAIAQDLAAKTRVGVVHCVSMAVSGVLALMGVRLLVSILPPLVNILVVTVFVTLIIVLLDYGSLLRSDREPTSH